MTKIEHSDASFRSDIQGLRAIAVLFVVFYHSDFFIKSGFIGVDVFFVISGYVITKSLKREIETKKNFSIKAFYARRIRRLLPGLAVMLTTVLLLTSWMGVISSRVQTVRTGMFAAFSISNLFLFRFRPDGYFVVAEKSNTLLHTWSLSIEEQFYLIYPLLVFLVFSISQKTRIRQNKIHLTLFGIIGGLSLVFSIYVCLKGLNISNQTLVRIFGTATIDSRFAFYMPLTRAWEFIAGVLIARIDLTSRNKKLSGIFSYIGLGLVVFSAFSLRTVDSFPGVAALLPVIGSALLILCMGQGNSVGKLLSRPFLVWLGDRSYGWYLWHWPVIQFVKPFFPTNELMLLTAGFGSLIPAAISYRWVEEKFRNDIKWRASRKMTLLIVSSLILPLIAAQSSRSLMPELDFHKDATIGCESGSLDAIEPGGRCFFPIKGALGSAVLIGDSHAGQLAEAFIPASHALGLNAQIAVLGNTPFLFRPWDDGFTKQSYPFEFISKIDRIKPDVVVIAQSGYDQNEPLGVDWSEEFLPILQALEIKNIPVVVVAASVNVGVYPQACSVLQINLGYCSAKKDLLTSELDQGRAYRVEQEKLAVSSVQNAVIMDTLPVLCPERICSTRRNGKWMWRDEAHISITASEMIYPLMKKSMKDALSLKN